MLVQSIFLTVLIFSIFGIVSILLLPKIQVSWLQKISQLIILSLPFERIPSLEIAGVSVRFSQIFVLIGMYFFALLFLKKDRILLAIKVNKINYFLIAFLVVSIPSYFAIVSIGKFLTSMIATLLVFGAAFLIANFEENPLMRLKELCVVIFFVTIFGAYQFVGDLIGVPFSLTGLRPQYTKIVFGIPRVQATALEPLYFAGMLYLPIFCSLFFDFIKLRIMPNFRNKILRMTTNNSSLFVFFSLLFIATYSKASILILIISLVLIASVSLWFGRNLLTKKIVGFFSFLIGVLTLAIAFIPKFARIFSVIIEFFYYTIIGKGVSATERLDFIDAFGRLIWKNPILGIGPGQFGIRALNYLPIYKFLGDYTAIVNNVYFEIWLEFGLVAIIVFLYMLGFYLFVNFRKIIRTSKFSSATNITRLVLVLALLCYCIQWLTFSPIFIMPIFIILGLLASLDNPKNKS
jgi:O-antigen ligase